MKPAVPALLLALVIALAGCADETVPGADAETDAGPADTQSTPGNQTTPTDAVRLALDATTVVVQEGNATLTGTVSGPAVLNVAYGDQSDSIDADGAWTYTFEPPFGHTEVVVTADDGTTAVNATVLVKRSMVVTVEVRYDPSAARADVSETFYWDYGGLRSLHEDASYQGCDQPHPGRPNAHDMLLDFEDVSGVDVGFSPCGQFGVGIDAVDGHESASFWCWQVNGETAEFGVSLLELEDGDVFAFVDCYVAFPQGP